jgi:tRNA U38,U39,U40 pseudouridine synthase TruA
LSAKLKPIVTARLAEEMPYLKMINSALPPDIQVLAWTTVPKDFSAR